MNIASFVLGIVSFLGGSLFLGILPVLGIIFGIIGLNKKEKNPGLGIAGIILSALSLVGFILLVAFASTAILAAAHAGRF